MVSLISSDSFEEGDLEGNCSLNCTLHRWDHPVTSLLVDISDMYHSIVNKEHTEGFFSTCASHRFHLEHQIHKFAKLSSNDEFWVLLCNKNRKPVLPVHSKIETFVRRGVPPQLRGRVWQALCGTNVSPDYYMKYSDLLNLPMQQENTEQIDKDLRRTFMGMHDTTILKRLGRVLTAYSTRTPKIGYCQGMNFIAGIMLLFMPEKPAFWTFLYVIEDLLPDYFGTLVGLKADIEVFEWLLSQHLPHIYDHFKLIGLEVELLISSWFMCLFVRDLPLETAALIWDNLMLDGITVMFEVALTLLRIYEEEIITMQDATDLINIIRKSNSQLHDPSQLQDKWLKLDKNRVLFIRNNVRKQKKENPTIPADFDFTKPAPSPPKPQGFVPFWDLAAGNKKWVV